MLIQGGMISSGRRFTVSVVGAYWISCIRSFWKTTLPGVVAMFSPILNAVMSVMLIASRPLPRSRSSSRFLQAVDQVLAAAVDRGAQHFGVGQHEIRRRHRVDELARIEIDLARGLVVEPVDLLDRRLHPARGQQIALLDEVEDRVVAPRLVAEAAVAGRGLDHRLGLAAEHALRRCAATASGSRSTATSAPAPACAGSAIMPRRHLEEGGADRRAGRPCRSAVPSSPAGLARQEIGDEALAALGDLGHAARQLGRIGQLAVLGLGHGPPARFGRRTRAPAGARRSRSRSRCSNCC